MAEKSYGKLVKALQIAAGIFMIAMVILCIVLTQKYSIKVSNIPEISKSLTGGTLALAIGIIVFSVVKSFALVFPPAVIFSVCGYIMPNFRVALLVNLISVFLSLFVPYFLGRFTGAGMVETLKGKFKAIKKIDDFTGANETEMTFAIKLSGIMPGDLSSLLFGAMGISFKNYTLGANLGNLPLVIVYTFFGITLRNVGEQPWVAAIPVAVIIVFMLIASLITKNLIKKTKARQNNNEQS